MHSEVFYITYLTSCSSEIWKCSCASGAVLAGCPIWCWKSSDRYGW